MMPRTKQFLRTRDIDWAVKIGNLYLHASSAGDDLPNIVDSHLTEIWDVLKKAEIVCAANEVPLNEDYLNRIFPLELVERDENMQMRREWYIHSFRAMAMRGFNSFDRDINTQIGESIYNLVASPKAGSRVPEYALPVIRAEVDLDVLASSNLVRVINDLDR